MLFSQRYKRIIDQGKLQVEIVETARRKLWAWLKANNSPVDVQRDPNDQWISQSSAIEEAGIQMLIEQGWDDFPDVKRDQYGSIQYLDGMRKQIIEGDATHVFDVVMLIAAQMVSPERELLPSKVNQILELHDCPWRYSEGEFFKIDGDFMGARMALTAHAALAANYFAGAADEYAKSRQYLGAQDSKEAIYYANNSFESVMQVMTGLQHANADSLIKELRSKGYFDDLPESIRGGFADQVLKALPFLRNKLGGHGQGAKVVEIPHSYAELAVQLAAAFHNFLIAKHLERHPPAPPAPPTPAPQDPPSWMADDIPF